MLTELRIQNLGVIVETVLELGPGLTVVTGETGAGKTMVVTGLGLVAGAKADARLVRRGADRALVEARFGEVGGDVTERVEATGGELDDGELLVTSIVAASRGRSLVGGVQVPAATAAEIGEDLVTIHGQTEQRRLATAERQRVVLDQAGGPQVAEVLARHRAAYAERRAVTAELTTLRRDAAARLRELEMLRFGLDEIAAVDPQPGEDRDLAAEAQRLQAVDDLRLSAQAAAVGLTGSDGDFDAPSALALVGEARKALEACAVQDARAEALATAARDAVAAVGDLAAEVSTYLAGLDADPGRLEWVAGRRAALQALTRKYGDTVDDVLTWSQQSAAAVTDLDGTDDRIADLARRADDLTVQVTATAQELTDLRTRAAGRLAEAVQTELAALALPHARLHFDVSPLPEIGPHGADAVVLLFSANPGAEPGPLSKVASGGELSRVRLALEVVLADTAGGATFVFDEVDAGVGGAVALEVGRRLAALARTRQVVVVTHLAQVAAFGDRHWVVAKTDDGSVTTSGLQEVSGIARQAELARMMGGEGESQTSLDHAAALLQRAGEDAKASPAPTRGGRRRKPSA